MTSAASLGVARRARPASIGWVAVVFLLAVSALVASPLATAPTTSAAERAVLIVLAGMVLVGSSLAFLRGLRRSHGAVGPLLAALAAAFVLGVLCAPGTWPRSGELALMLGLTTVAVVCLGLRLPAIQSVYEKLLATMSAWCAVCAIGLTAILALDWPASSLAALITAITPMMLRMQPAVSISVPSEQLLDHSILMKLRWAVRSPIPAPPRKIDAGEVRSLVHAGRLQQSASTGFWCLAAVVAYAVIAQGNSDSALERIATWVLSLSLASFLLLSPRHARGTMERWAPRLAALAVLALFVTRWLPSVLSTEGITITIATLMAVGILVGVFAIPAGSGVTSLGLSRFGDFLEGASIFLVVPAGIIAGGFIELFRGLV